MRTMEGTSQSLARRIDLIRDIPTDRLIPEDQRHRCSPEELGIGGVFRLDSKHYLIRSLGTYQETDDTFKIHLEDKWKEFKVICLESGEQFYLEILNDDGLEIWFTTQEVPYRQLRTVDCEKVPVEGIAFDNFAKDVGQLRCFDTTWDFTGSYSAIYKSSDPEKPEGYLYGYDFESGNSVISVEFWIKGQGAVENYKVWRSEKVVADDIVPLYRGEPSV